MPKAVLGPNKPYTGVFVSIQWDPLSLLFIIFWHLIPYLDLFQVLEDSLNSPWQIKLQLSDMKVEI